MFLVKAGVRVLNEAAEIYFATHPDTDRSVHTQRRIQNFSLTREQTAYQPGTDLIIVDRSVLDPVVYTMIFDTAENADRLLDNVRHWLPTYTGLFLLDPTGVPHDPGPNRSETEEQRLRIHNVFKEVCQNNNLPIIEVSGSLQERTDSVYRVIFDRVRNKTIFDRSRGDSGTNHI